MTIAQKLFGRQSCGEKHERIKIHKVHGICKTEYTHPEKAGNPLVSNTGASTLVYVCLLQTVTSVHFHNATLPRKPVAVQDDTSSSLASLHPFAIVGSKAPHPHPASSLIQALAHCCPFPTL
jgi:hypothetical protein